jgi:hypothetical protein
MTKGGGVSGTGQAGAGQAGEGDALSAELDRWAEAGLTARFWLRDDDAVADSPALRRLLDAFAPAAAPLLLAVIPLRFEDSLPAVIAAEPCLRPAMHGVLHENHAPDGVKSEELPPERGKEAITAALAAGRARLVGAFGEEAGHWYVPPWNRIAPQVAAWLPDCGVRVLSTFGDKPTATPAGLARLDTQIDIIDWRSGRVGRTARWAAETVAHSLAARRLDRPDRPIGVLSHHLAHDEAAWACLSYLVAAIAAHPAACWADPNELARTSLVMDAPQ